MKKRFFILLDLIALIFIVCCFSCQKKANSNIESTTELSIPAVAAPAIQPVENVQPVESGDFVESEDFNEDINIRTQTVSTAEYLRAFYDNKLSAKNAYIGKEIILVGEIKNIDKSLTGKPRVSLRWDFTRNTLRKDNDIVENAQAFIIDWVKKRKDKLKDIDCYFSKNDLDNILNVKKGDIVQIKGTVKNKDTLTDCSSIQLYVDKKAWR